MAFTHISYRNTRIHSVGFSLYLLGLFSLSTGVAVAQPSSSNTLNKDSAQPAIASGRLPAKVAILVTPTSADTARIVLSYGTRVSHTRVQEDIRQVAHFTRGNVERGVKIEDASLDPQNLKRFPVMTAAQFDIRQAPQFQEDEPRVLPYLQAFQGWRSLDVLVHLPGVAPSADTQRFESAAISVWLNRDQGMMRYHAEIGAANRVETLQSLQFTTPSPPQPLHATDRVTEKTGIGSLLPILLIGVGVSIAGGACLYLFAMKRIARNASARSFLS